MSDRLGTGGNRDSPVEEIISMWREAADEIEGGEWETHHEPTPAGDSDE